MLNIRKRNIALVGGIINVLILLLVVKNYGGRIQYIEDIIIYVYSYFDFLNLKTLIAIVIVIINPILIIVATGEDVQGELKTFGPYIFTRGKSRRAFFLNKIFGIASYTVIYMVFQIILIIMVGGILGIGVKNGSVLAEVSMYVTLMSLSSILVMAVLANVMNLVMEFKYILMMLLLYQVGIFSLFKYTNLIESKIVQYIPSINRIFGWYESELINESFRNIFTIRNGEIITGISLITNGIILLTIIVIGIKIINKKNII